MSFGSVVDHLRAPFNGSDKTTDPLPDLMEAIRQRLGGGGDHVDDVDQAPARRRAHPLTWALWAVGPVTAAYGWWIAASARWLAVGVLLLIVQALNRWGLRRYGVPLWLRSLFVVCTLAAALLAAEPLIFERAVVVYGSVTGK